MGRIKSTLIKRTAKELERDEDLFSEDFDANKKLLKGTMPSKKVQNKVAGYITKLRKTRNAERITKKE